MKWILCSDWLPEWARWAYLARSGLPALVPQKRKSFGHLINPLLTKLVRSRWLEIGLVLFCVFMDLAFVSVHKNAKKNLANIQPSWPHAWSITHIQWLGRCSSRDLLIDRPSRLPRWGLGGGGGGGERRSNLRDQVQLSTSPPTTLTSYLLQYRLEVSYRSTIRHQMTPRNTPLLWCPAPRRGNIWRKHKQNISTCAWQQILKTNIQGNVWQS